MVFYSSAHSENLQMVFPCVWFVSQQFILWGFKKLPFIHLSVLKARKFCQTTFPSGIWNLYQHN